MYIVLAASVSGPSNPFVDPSGSLYFIDGCTRVRQISTTRLITTIAGGGAPDNKGDGGPATSAGLNPVSIIAGVTVASSLREKFMAVAIDSAKTEKADDGQFLAFADVYYSQRRTAGSDAFLAKAIAMNADSCAGAIALVYAWRVGTDKAMQWLERASKKHDEQLYLL